MITTTGRYRDKFKTSRLFSRRGFSLVEVIIASSIGLMVSAAIFSTFLFIARGSVGIINYSDMNTESRSGLETFGRDIRSAETISAGFSSTEFTINREDGTTVKYTYRSTLKNKPLVRVPSDGDESIVMEGVENLNFLYYNLQGGAASVPLEVKQIQLQLKLVRKTISLDNTERVVSARFILRNKKVSN